MESPLVRQLVSTNRLSQLPTRSSPAPRLGLSATRQTQTKDQTVVTPSMVRKPTGNRLNSLRLYLLQLQLCLAAPSHCVCVDQLQLQQQQRVFITLGLCDGAGAGPLGSLAPNKADASSHARATRIAECILCVR